MNKVEYGLSKCGVFPILSTASDGTPSYGPFINLPGAKELKLDAEGDSVSVPADNVTWWQTTPNNGYSGSVTLKAIPDSFYTEILRETVDSNGVYLENSDSQPREFAFVCQFEGDEKAARRIFYRAACGRPAQGSSTKTSTIEPNDMVINLTISPRLNDHKIKAKCYADSAAYATFFENVYEESAGTQATESFTGDGTKTDFALASTPTRISAVYVNGALNTGYTVTNKTVKFATAPANGAVITITYLHA